MMHSRFVTVKEIWFSIDSQVEYFKIGESAVSGKEDYSDSKVISINTENSTVAVEFENETFRVFSNITFQAKGVIEAK